MLYMLLICYDQTAPSEEPVKNRQPEHHALELELRERGLYVSGAALWPVGGAKSVRHSGERVIITDGPYAESKEALGGYFLVECEEAEAIEIAGRVPTDARSWIQVRRVALFHPNSKRIAELSDG